MSTIRRTSPNHPPVMWYRDGSGYPGHAGRFAADMIAADGKWIMFEGTAWSEDQAHEVLEEECVYECEDCGEFCEPVVREASGKYRASWCRRCVNKDAARFVQMSTAEDPDRDEPAVRWRSVEILLEIAHGVRTGRQLDEEAASRD
jgi:hypothetical protein